MSQIINLTPEEREGAASAHFRVDALSAFFLCVINLGSAGASLYGLGYGRHEAAPERILPFFPVFLAGMNLVLLADDGSGWKVVGAKLTRFGSDPWYGDPLRYVLIIGTGIAARNRGEEVTLLEGIAVEIHLDAAFGG